MHSTAVRRDHGSRDSSDSVAWHTLPPLTLHPSSRLPQAYALEFAKRGAAVVVNDLGGGMKGEGK